MGMGTGIVEGQYTMNILLVIPKYEKDVRENHYHYPIGLAYIAAVLKEAGHSVDILDFNKYFGYINAWGWLPVKAQLERQLSVKEYAIVGTGGLSFDYDMIKATVSFAKQLQPSITTIVGGNIITAEPEAVFADLLTDFGVIGEGEETIVELIAALARGSKRFDLINGIVFNSNGSIVRTSKRINVRSIDALPFPDYDGLDLEYYLEQQLPADHVFWHPYDKPRWLPILSSRSCVYQCTFCYHPEKFRVRSLDSVFDEIKMLVSKYRINMLSLSDELLGADKKRLREFCSRIKPYGLKWACQLHINNVESGLLDLMKDAGCVLISYGIESMNDTVLKSMKKAVTRSQIEEGLRLTYEKGIQIQGNLIFGDTAETSETAAESLTWWYNHRQYQINLARVIPYPGSEIYQNAVDAGIITDKIEFMKNDCQQLSSLNLSSMSDAEFNYLNLANGAFTAVAGRIPARVHSVCLDGYHHLKGPLFSLEIECPHCRAIAVYRNMHTKLNPWQKFMLRIRIGCKECYQRFDILPFELEQLLLEILVGARVAIFKADNRSSLLLKNSPLLKQQTVCVIEDDYTKIILDICGKQIVPLYYNIEYIVSNVDVIVVTGNMPSNSDAWLALVEQQGVKRIDLSNFWGDDLQFVEQEQLARYVEQHWLEILQEMDGGNLAKAHHLTLKLLDVISGFTPAYQLLAEIAHRHGDGRVALDALATATAIDQDNSKILKSYATLCQYYGFNRLAIKLLTANLDSKDQGSENIIQLLLIYARNGQYEEAVTAFSRYLATIETTKSKQELVEIFSHINRQLLMVPCLAPIKQELSTYFTNLISDNWSECAVERLAR